MTDRERWNETTDHIKVASIRQPRYLLRNINTMKIGFLMDADSMRESGKLASVLVSYEGEDANGEPVYECINGWKGVHIARLLNDETIPAIIRHNVRDDERMLWSIQANRSEYETSPMEFARQLERWVATQEEGLTQSEMAKRVGCGDSTISEYLSLNKLITEAQAEVERGRISVGKARILSRVPQEDQAKFIPPAIELNLADFKALAEPYIRTVRANRKRSRLAKRLGARALPEPVWRGRQPTVHEIANPRAAKRLSKGLTPEEAFTEGVRWTVQLDKESLAKLEKHLAEKDRQAEEEHKRRYGKLLPQTHEDETT